MRGLVLFLLAVLSVAQDVPFSVGNGVSAPSVVSRVDPQYPEEARRAKAQSSVMLSMVVGVDGKAQDVKVAHGAGFGMDEKAIEAVQKWQFRPGMRNGIAVPVRARFEVSFSLQLRRGESPYPNARLTFTLPAGASRPELIAGKVPGSPAGTGSQSLRISMQVDKAGLVRNVTVVASTDEAWKQQALSEIQSWRFRPANVNGVAITADGIFELAGSGKLFPRLQIIPVAGNNVAH
jgi:TonB family protein